MKKTNSQKLKDVAREFHRGWPDRTIICCLWVTDLRHNFFRTFLLKKCFHFGCPSLGHNSEFWFYHQKCHFFVSTFRNLSDHKRFNWGTKIKILWLHSKKMSPQRESRFWSKNVKLQPHCRQAVAKMSKAKLLPKHGDIISSLVPSK